MYFLAAGTLTQHDITVLFLSLAVLLGTAKLLGELARRYQQPVVIGEILAGVLLGPTVLAQFTPGGYAWLFPAEGANRIFLDGFSIMAVGFLLLVAGLEVDLSTIWKQGKATALVSITGMVFPLVLGCGVAWAMPQTLGKNPAGDMLPFVLFIGIAMSITALPVIARILIDINLLKTDTGMLIMSAAMVNDLCGWMGFALVLALMRGDDPAGGGSGGVASTIVLTLLFVALMLTVGRWLVHRSLPFVQAHSAWPGGVIGYVLVLTMLAAAATEAIGIHAIFGAFIAGVVIGDSAHLRERTRDTIAQFITNIFAPVFFATIGLRVNFISSFDLTAVLIVLVVAIVTKTCGCYLGAVWAGLNKRESWAIGFGMSARGAMEIVLGQLALKAGLITDGLFVAIVIMALATSLISGPAMQRILQRKARRHLADMLTEKQFVAVMRATDARGAIVELAELAAGIAKVEAGQIVEAVWQRERLMSTGIGNMIAVPHARLAQLTRPTVVIGRSGQGIDFDAPDGQTARIICLLLSPESDSASQIDLLRMVAESLGDAPSRDMALAARSYVEFLAALKLPEEANVRNEGKAHAA
jgi:Kef-type K+ transport system membrane component KefB/mannitol/fructose-specific phosphotransferase system IIA component (Ntr-type)